MNYQTHISFMRNDLAINMLKIAEPEPNNVPL